MNFDEPSQNIVQDHLDEMSKQEERHRIREEEIRSRMDRKLAELHERLHLESCQLKQKNAAREAARRRVLQWTASSCESQSRKLADLLASLETVLYPSATWESVSIEDLQEVSDIRRCYYKALYQVHPDRFLSRSLAPDQVVLAELVTHELMTSHESWMSHLAEVQAAREKALAEAERAAAREREAAAVRERAAERARMKMEEIRIREEAEENEKKRKEKAQESAQMCIDRWMGYGPFRGSLIIMLSTLDDVLYSGATWKKVSMETLLESRSKLKKFYHKAILQVHPDKTGCKKLSPDQAVLAEMVFRELQEAWEMWNSGKENQAPAEPNYTSTETSRGYANYDSRSYGGSGWSRAGGHSHDFNFGYNSGARNSY